MAPPEEKGQQEADTGQCQSKYHKGRPIDQLNMVPARRGQGKSGEGKIQTQETLFTAVNLHVPARIMGYQIGRAHV